MTDATGRHEQPAGAIRVTVAGPVTGPATRERRDRGDREETGDGSYFAPLAKARYLLLTTFKQKGTPVSAVVQGVADGDRAYFRVRSRSGTARRLRHTDGVQVTPCSALGLWSYGPPLDAAVRPLAGGEAIRVAGQLDRTYPVRHRSLAWPVHWASRRRLAYYELLLRVSIARDVKAFPHASYRTSIGVSNTGLPLGVPSTDSTVRLPVARSTRIRAPRPRPGPAGACSMSSTTTEFAESLAMLTGKTKPGPVPRVGPEISVRSPVTGSTDMIVPFWSMR
jgi:PPOX class probable F420-dependent enzyme